MKLGTIAITLLVAVLLAAASSAMAGPPTDQKVYEKGTGATHQTTCTPPTTRAPNADGVKVPITEQELKETKIWLYNNVTDINPGDLLAGPITADIYCTTTWNIDDYPAGQKQARASITDTDGRESTITVDGGYFLSELPLMPPNPPAMAD